jgi:hypothetical protein
MVFRTLISRINRQFIHLNANWMNSTFWASRCDASGAVDRKLPDYSTGNINTEHRLTIDPSNKFGHPPHTSLDTRLSRNIVVLYPVQQTRQTPERICLDGVQHVSRQVRRIVHFRVRVWNNASKMRHGMKRSKKRVPMYADKNTWKNGVTRSFIPWTYPLAGCRMAQTYKIRSRLCAYEYRTIRFNVRLSTVETYSLRAPVHP